MSIYNRPRFTMKRVIPAVTLSLLLGTTAYAAAVHFKPAKTGPAFDDQTLVLNASGGLSGLGNETLQVQLTATETPTANCTNPAGQTQPPGRNPATVTLTGAQNITPDQIKNGNVSFSVTTNPPTSPIPDAPECPNSGWTETITDVSFTTATIRVFQPPTAPSAALTAACTFSPATANGPVPSSDVSCP